MAAKHKNMKRYIFNTLMALSLLLLLATAGLWVDSYWHYASLRIKDGKISYVAENLDGRIITGWLESMIPPVVPYGGLTLEELDWEWQRQSPPFVSLFQPKTPLYVDSSLIGFGYAASPDWSGVIRNLVQVPHWFLALFFTIFPTIWFIKWNKRRKLGPNACPGCGYDLTGNESGACPECGAQLKAEV